jgi:ParB family chromosome partitioning protein
MSQASQPGPAGQAGDAPPKEVPTHALRPNRHQPRSAFDDAAMEGLAASLRQHGMVQPIVARRAGDGFEIIAGERRWRAAKKIGLPTVPVIVKDVPDDRLLEFALVENIQRQELNPIEEARAYFQLGEHLRLTQEQVADRVGKSRPQVANTLRLLRLPADVQDMVAGGALSAGHAKVLLGADEPRLQRQLAAEVAEGQLSVRALEGLLRRAGRAPRGRGAGKGGAPQSVFVRAAQEELTLAWTTRVEIRPRGRGGSLVFHFADEAELDRLFEGMKAGPIIEGDGG